MFQVKWSTFQLAFEQSHVSEMSPVLNFVEQQTPLLELCVHWVVTSNWELSLDISELHASMYMEGKHADEFKQVIIT